MLDDVAGMDAVEALQPTIQGTGVGDFGVEAHIGAGLDHQGVEIDAQAAHVPLLQQLEEMAGTAAHVEDQLQPRKASA